MVESGNVLVLVILQFLPSCILGIHDSRVFGAQSERNKFLPFLVDTLHVAVTLLNCTIERVGTSDEYFNKVNVISCLIRLAKIYDEDPFSISFSLVVVQRYMFMCMYHIHLPV